MTEVIAGPTLIKLVNSVRPFVPAADELAPGLIFQEWLGQALALFAGKQEPSSFAPFNAYFSSQRDYRASFAFFVAAEIGSEDLGSVQAKSILVRGLQRALQQALDDTKPYSAAGIAGASRLSHTVFDLFEILLDIDSETAFAWAARAVRPQSAFSAMYSPGGLPAPLALYSSLVGYDAVGAEKVEFLTALLEWCIGNAQLPEVLPIARKLLPAVLSAMVGADRAERQVALINRFFSPSGSELIEELDRLIDSEGNILGQDLMASEGRNLRSAMDPAAPIVIQRLSEWQKGLLRRSYLIATAFDLELRRETKPFKDEQGYIGSLLYRLGIRQEILGNVSSRMPPGAVHAGI